MSAGVAVSTSSPPSAGFLVSRVKTGDRQAWDALVERYAPLVWSICRRYRLSNADAEDVGQCVWLHLVAHVGTIRDPATLPGWLVTTTRRECARVLRSARWEHPGEHVLDVENIAAETNRTAEEEMLAAERHAALREALTGLPPGWQRLMVMLAADPPVPYAEISSRLGIAIGSIGPTRARCLDRLRRHPAIAALADIGGGAAEGSRPDG
jgi:RNA polymerase sigma factor (sigma-70 family)